MYKSTSALLIAAAILSACATGPDYQRPDIKFASTYNTATDQFSNTQSMLTNRQWWNLFGDTQLDVLINRALKNNFDIRIALARVEASRAALAGSEWNFLPSGGISAEHNKGRLSAAESTSGTASNFETARAGADVRWELDLFGRLRRETELHGALAGAAEADRYAVELMVASEVASRYFEYQSFLLRRQALHESLLRQQQHMQLFEERVSYGFAGEFELRRVSAEVAATHAMLADMEAALAVSRNRLSLVTGAMPGDINIKENNFMTFKVNTISLGQPEQLLRRRPDVIAAENLLHAQVSAIGVAVSEYFPQLSLNGTLAFVAGSFGDLGTSASRSWVAGPSISIPLLDFGRIAERVDQRKAEARAAQAMYEKAVHAAVADVEDGIARYQAATTRLQATDQRMRDALTSSEIINVRFHEGAADYLAVVDIERLVFDAQASRAASLAEHRIALIALIKALGGGWNDAEML